MTGYVAAGVILHFDLFRIGVVGRRRRWPGGGAVACGPAPLLRVPVRTISR